MNIAGLPLEIVGIIIIFAILLSVIIKKIGLNPVLGYIISGFILGPFLFNYLHPEAELVVGFAELGLFILLFYLGLELSLKNFLKAGSASFGLAVIDMTLSTGVGFFICMLLGYSWLFSIIIGFMLFSTSTAIVAKFAIDKKILQEQPTQLAISILILQDFLGILLLVFITTFSSGGTSSIELAIKALVFAVSSFYVVRQLSQRVGAWLIKNGYSDTEVTLYAIGIGLVVSTAGVFLGLSSTLGAYFAGFALAETPSGERIKKDVNFMRDFFLVFFFVSFGTTIFYNSELKMVVLPELAKLGVLFGISVVLVFLAALAHFISTVIFGPIFGLAKKDAPITAILLVPLGEFVVIIATVSAKVLDPAEGALVSVIAFLLIAVSIVIFQPLYNNIEFFKLIERFLPSPFKLKEEKTVLRAVDPTEIKLLKSIGLNLLIVLSLAWVTLFLYYDLPRFGVPILYSRQFTAGTIFVLFAVLPAYNIFRNVKKLLQVLVKDMERTLRSKKK
jgi:Kef-type K+ transport system membrane component KefB